MYNNTYLAECDENARGEWLGGLDKIAASEGSSGRP